MRSKYFGQNVTAVVVLGAGASRGASFVSQIPAHRPLPALDRDFFAELEKLRQYRDVCQFLKSYDEEFRRTSPMGMEAFFTQVEFLDMLNQQLPAGAGRKTAKYGRMQSEFKAALCVLFNDFLDHGICQYHEQLVDALTGGDAIITFNYDCIIDSALCSKGATRWRPQDGYCVNVIAGAHHWQPAPGVGKPSTNSIKLLKMHGSLNWKRTQNSDVELCVAPYRSTDIEIIPPMWNKPVTTDPLFRSIWQEARRALLSANAIVFAGYSLPFTDLLAQSLIRDRSTAGQAANLKAVVIANPNDGACDRVMGLLADAISPGTALLRFSDMEGLAGYLSK